MVATDLIHVDGEVGTARYLVNRQLRYENVDGKVFSKADNGYGRSLFSGAAIALCSHRVLKLAPVNSPVAVGVNGQNFFPPRQVFNAERNGRIVVFAVENAVAIAIERTQGFIPAFPFAGVAFFKAGRSSREIKALLFSC